MDVLEERLGKQNLADLVKEERVSVQTFEHMRGRTFKSAYIMLDEAQNTTVDQMMMFLTRTGEGSRVVVSGDLKQSDIGPRNGLAFAMALIDRQRLPVPVVLLKEVVRSGAAAMWVKALNEDDGGLVDGAVHRQADAATKADGRLPSAA